MNSLEDYSMVDLLPASLKQDPFMVVLAEAVDIQLKQIVQEAEPLYNLRDVDNLPESILDFLAFLKHVDFYENDLPIQKKRDLIKNSTKWHRKKGTKWAVEQVVSIVFDKAKVTEWFVYGGNPYFFRVETEETLKGPTDFNRLIKMIDATKNKRSWLEDITVKRTDQMDLYVGGLISEWKQITLNPIEFKMPNLEGTEKGAGYISTWNQTIIQSEVSVDG